MSKLPWAFGPRYLLFAISPAGPFLIAQLLYSNFQDFELKNIDWLATQWARCSIWLFLDSLEQCQSVWSLAPNPIFPQARFFGRIFCANSPEVCRKIQKRDREANQNPCCLPSLGLVQDIMTAPKGDGFVSVFHTTGFYTNRNTLNPFAYFLLDIFTDMLALSKHICANSVFLLGQETCSFS